MSVEREAIIAAARSWIGTTYQHQASLRHIGCDCLGLLRGVWREVIGPEPELIPPYSAGWMSVVQKRDPSGSARSAFSTQGGRRLSFGRHSCFSLSKTSAGQSYRHRRHADIDDTRTFWRMRCGSSGRRSLASSPCGGAVLPGSCDLRPVPVLS